MAVPRVFVSSTYYDLKHIRASLDHFIRSMGFESVLSEKGDIAYAFDRPLDESCYAEVSNCDMLLLIVGGRYGSAASDVQLDRRPDFFKRYDSITRREYERALSENRPVWILVEAAVMAEYQTYKVNLGRADVRYAHVDSVNIFELLESISGQVQNNALSTFQTFGDIEEWLRKQWAGYFGDLLRRRTGQVELMTLSAQVQEMRDLNQTLKTYMEKVVTSVAPNESQALIGHEDRRLRERQRMRLASSNEIVVAINHQARIPPEASIPIISRAKSVRQLLGELADKANTVDAVVTLFEWYDTVPEAVLRDVNAVRGLFGQRALKAQRVERAALDAALARLADRQAAMAAQEPDVQAVNGLEGEAEDEEFHLDETDSDDLDLAHLADEGPAGKID